MNYPRHTWNRCAHGFAYYKVLYIHARQYQYLYLFFRNLKIHGLPLLTWVRSLPLSPSVPHLELTDDDIPTLPKLDFTGKFCLIKGPYDEERYNEELKTVQEASMYII